MLTKPSRLRSAWYIHLSSQLSSCACANDPFDSLFHSSATQMVTEDHKVHRVLISRELAATPRPSATGENPGPRASVPVPRERCACLAGWARSHCDGAALSLGTDLRGREGVYMTQVRVFSLRPASECLT
ncbi:hypothetical protein L227DRAFT_305301 [Lentinus tigrinus ALCF2SS1-6]|uniref:Uncharacterized protein n=1 Tax=Lentinus tigrinus ALCF2SS1-6 TaxID=1328759 RepID=A0A5C2RX30_9APHY|nr:hypothetical protein L227DRAFT_305301 [Lentinus tigrinus ALCF2SS1-6]